MAIKSLIVEDDLLSMAMLRDLLEDYFPDVLIAGMTRTVRDSVKFLDENQVDLLFLDIELPDGKGFDIIKGTVNRDFSVIITTAYPSYTIDYQSFSFIAFVVKPVSRQALEEAVRAYKATISDTGNSRKFNQP